MLQPIYGYFADGMQKRTFMIWGLIFSAVFIPLTIKTNTILLFALCLFLGMFGNAVFHPQVSALIKDFNKNNPNLSKAMGIFLGLGTIGYAIGPYLSTFLVERFGQDSLLYLSLLGISSAIFMYFFVPKMPKKNIEQKESFLKIIKEIFKNKPCMFLTYISVIKSAVSVSFGTYIPFLLQKHGFSLEQTGLIVTLFFISGASATILSSKLEKYIKPYGIIVLSFISILPLTILFLNILPQNKILACLIFILIGFFILLSVGIILVLAQKAMPNHTAVISGIMQGFSWGIGALFLAPLGFIGENYGIDKILIIMAIIAFLTGIYAINNKYLKEIK